jgi:hypothetical protein
MQRIKQYFDRFLRMVHLRHFADVFLFSISVVRDFGSNIAFKKSHPGYAVPPLRLMYDAFDHTRYQEYLETGQAHAKDIAHLLQIYAGDIFKSDLVRIGEWGCGPAKIIRNLPDFLPGQNIRFYGTDYNRKTIAWCKKTIPTMTFVDNNLQPPLEFNENFFAIVFARSVFTHLSEKMHFAWIAELFRIVNKKGILLFTTNGPNFLNRLIPHEQELFRNGHMVSTQGVFEGKKYFASFHPPRFVRESLLKGRKIIAYIPQENAGTIGQDVWICRK